MRGEDGRQPGRGTGCHDQGDLRKSQIGTPGDLTGVKHQERVTSKRMKSAFTSVTSFVRGSRAPV